MNGMRLSFGSLLLLLASQSGHHHHRASFLLPFMLFLVHPPPPRWNTIYPEEDYIGLSDVGVGQAADNDKNGLDK
jgi:hypothetical protein